MDYLKIHVYGAYEDDTSKLFGANVFWLGTTEGASSDEKGIAALPFHKHLPHDLVITYVGLQNDTVAILNQDKKHYYVFLPDDDLLKTIEVTRKKQSSYISTIDPIRSDIIGENELKKAACCDLSESFETNASVDVSYSDAVTGAKEIQLLGLDGVYVEMLEQNVPSLRGLAIPFGLSYVPGPWLQSISIAKGAGSILSGHESITGTINYQFKRPFETERFILDLFGNHQGRYELNAITGYELNDRVGGVLALNGGGLHSRHDYNNDGFLDQPLYDRFNIMNRWMFQGNKMRGQLSVNYLLDDRSGGQIDFNSEDKGTTNAYGLGMKTNRLEAYGKTAYFFEKKPYQNIALLYSINYHDQRGFFGLREYIGDQLSFNTTLLFQTIIKTSDHGVVVGGNTHVDHYNEQFSTISLTDKFWDLGAFLEYTYSYLTKLKIVGGLRLDYHNEHDLQFSPRVHIKWSPVDKSTIRLSAGRGFRNARVLGENVSLMASSREFVIEETIGVEAAWNTGISFVQKFNVGEKQGHMALDFYHTNFQKQVIIDGNGMNNLLSIYNLKGKSYANSFLAEVSYDLFKGFNLKLAYKMDDVKTTFKSGLETKPYTFLHKGLLVAHYQSKNEKWQIDVNFDMHGKHRLPSSFEGDITDSFSPFYIQLGAQVSKFFDNGIEIYVGGENITNYRQPNPIIGADDPFGDRFDTSQVWGPIVGGIFYGGFRYYLKKKSEL
ncbi:MAG: TonB-dependent receptor [Chitinophagales bacterium]